MRVVAISDIHDNYPLIPETDLLIIAGDITQHGKFDEFIRFEEWLTKCKATYKIFIGGNHDLLFGKFPDTGFHIAKRAGAIYLYDQLITLNGLRIYGTPWIPPVWGAFNAKDDRWAEMIPADLDILITHGPPYQMLDWAPQCGSVGSGALMSRVLKTKPRYHIFGHIHYSRGEQYFNGTCFMNVAMCGEHLLSQTIVNKPTVFDIGIKPGAHPGCPWP